MKKILILIVFLLKILDVTAQVKWVVEPKYGDLGYYSEGLIPFRRMKYTKQLNYPESIWGYIDKNGTVIIKPTYQEANSFSNGLADVKYPDEQITNDDRIGSTTHENAWITVNSKGQIIGEAGSLSEGCQFSEGIGIRHTTSEKVTYINLKNKKITNLKFDVCTPFSEGVAWVRDKNLWAIINKEMIIIKQFLTINQVNRFSEGLASVRLNNNMWGFINKMGEFEINPTFEVVGNFSEELAAVKIANKWGFINKTAKTIINPQYNYAHSFSDRLAWIRLNNKWGAIDKTGKMIIQPQFDDYGRFSTGLAPVKLNDKWGFIDKTGRMVISPQFDEVRWRNNNEVISVKLGNLWGIIKNPLL